MGEVFAKRRIGEQRWSGEQQKSARDREGVLRLQPKPGGVRRGEREGEMERERRGSARRDLTRQNVNKADASTGQSRRRIYQASPTPQFGGARGAPPRKGFWRCLRDPALSLGAPPILAR